MRTICDGGTVLWEFLNFTYLLPCSYYRYLIPPVEHNQEDWSIISRYTHIFILQVNFVSWNQTLAFLIYYFPSKPRHQREHPACGLSSSPLYLDSLIWATILTWTSCVEHLVIRRENVKVKHIILAGVDSHEKNKAVVPFLALLSTTLQPHISSPSSIVSPMSAKTRFSQ